MTDEIPDEVKQVVALGEGVDVEAVTEAGPLMSDAFDEGATDEGQTHG